MDYGYRHSQPSKGTFIFPMLKNQEIIDCMEDMQIPFTSEDLQRPTQSRMQAVYENFCDILMGVTREEIEAVDSSALDLEYADIYQNSLVLMSFYKQLLRIMIVVGIEDFSFRDLVKPEPARVRRIMSAIINFVKFREERMSMLEQYTSKAEEYADQLLMLQQENQELAQRLEELRIQRQREEPLVQQRKEENAGLQAELRELKKHQSGLCAEIEELKNAKDNLADTLTTKQYAVVEVKEAIAKLQARIVHSPEKIKQHIEKLNRELQEMKQQIGEQESAAHKMHVRMDMLEVVEQDILACTRLMKECLSESQKCDELMRRIHDDRDQIEKRTMEISNIEVAQQQLDRQIAVVEEKLSRLYKSQQQRREAVARKMNELTQEYTNLQREREEIQRKIDAQRQIAEEKERKSAELRRHMEQEMSAIQAEYTRLYKQVEAYQETILQSIIVPGGIFR